MFVATLLAVVVRTYVVFLVKNSKEGGLDFDAKFHATALLSIAIGSLFPAIEIFLAYEILPECPWWEAALLTFFAVSGLNGFFNRWGITALLKKFEPEPIVPPELYDPPPDPP